MRVSQTTHPIEHTQGKQGGSGTFGTRTFQHTQYIKKPLCLLRTQSQSAPLPSLCRACHCTSGALSFRCDSPTRKAHHKGHRAPQMGFERTGGRAENLFKRRGAWQAACQRRPGKEWLRVREQVREREREQERGHAREWARTWSRARDTGVVMGTGTVRTHPPTTNDTRNIAEVEIGSLNAEVAIAVTCSTNMAAHNHK
jgi:hypothetical protein